MALAHSPRIVTDGLVLALDAKNTKSLVTEDDPNVSLLLNGDGTNNSTTFTDSSSNNHSLTANGGTVISTAQSKFGGSSIFFDGTDDYLTATDSTFAFGTGQFTVEFWMYTVSKENRETKLVTYNISNSRDFEIRVGGANALQLRVYYGDSKIDTSYPSLNTWHHIAVTRDSSNVYRVFVNGVLGNSVTTTFNFDGTILNIGKHRDSNYFFHGYLDDIRITKGVARYTSNFTPPTAALSSRTSSQWTDLIGGNTVTLTNGPTYSSDNGGAVVFDGSNDYVDVSGSTTVSAATFLAWVRLDGDQNSNAGVIFSRGADVSGMNFRGLTEEISYHWNGAVNTYSWNSGLTVPQQEWCMMAVTVTSSVATAYLCRSSGTTSATNNVSHGSTTLDSIEIGRDQLGRYFDGRISVAMVYNKALTASEVQQNYNALKGRYA